ncbi:MAG: nucleotidyltransferase domain-containing protein [Cyanobacteria bacterium J06573_11]
MNHGLLSRDLQYIREAVAEIKEIDQVVLFGSRAKGTHYRGSDVDLSIRGKGITYDTVLQLSRSLNEEYPLPYFFDILDYDSLKEDEPIKAHIDRVGIVLLHRIDAQIDGCP